ncbi:MAG: hypothetical protein HYY40_12760 [Bacteroidetes bacterium]|nr:hypothetical protein [Bacteroidota bacterium]
MKTLFRISLIVDLFFYIAIILNALPLFCLKFFPTLDGASHLYNANIIDRLISDKSSIIHDFFTMNTFPVPNWTTNILLACTNFFLPAFIAEKIVLVIYLVGLPLSFKYFIMSVAPNNNGLAFFIFPFCYSFLFYMGFYNFCFSFIFVFLAMANYFKQEGIFSGKRTLIFFILVILIYFSHAVTFGFFIIVFIFSVMMKNLPVIFNPGNLKSIKKEIKNNRWIILLLLVILVLFIGFLSVHFTSFSGASQPFSVLCQWIFLCKPVITFVYETEYKYTTVFFLTALSIFIMVLFKRASDMKKGSDVSHKRNIDIITSGLNKSDGILFSSLGIIILFFIVPDNSLAGMMSDRLILLFYIFFIMWLAVQSVPRWLTYVAAAIIIFCQFNLVKNRFKINKELSECASEIYQVTNYIEDGSVILPVNYSDNYLLTHFSNYTAVEKDVVVLENVEASMRWFPVKWNEAKIPRLFLGNYLDFPHVYFPLSRQEPTQKPIDYVLIWGDMQKLFMEREKRIKDALSESYSEVFSNSSNTIKLFKYHAAD